MSATSYVKFQKAVKALRRDAHILQSIDLNRLAQDSSVAPGLGYFLKNSTLDRHSKKRLQHAAKRSKSVREPGVERRPSSKRNGVHGLERPQRRHDGRRDAKLEQYASPRVPANGEGPEDMEVDTPPPKPARARPVPAPRAGMLKKKADQGQIVKETDEKVKVITAPLTLG